MKASVIDMIQFVKDWNAHINYLNTNNLNNDNDKTIDMSRIVLLLNSTSPIGDPEMDTLEAIMRREGCTVMS